MLVKSVFSEDTTKRLVFRICLKKKYKKEDTKTILLESILTTHSKKPAVLTPRPSNPSSGNLFCGNHLIYQGSHHHIICKNKKLEAT